MFLHRKATLAVIKVISSSPKSELNFVMTSTWFFFFFKKCFARILFDKTRSEKRT